MWLNILRVIIKEIHIIKKAHNEHDENLIKNGQENMWGVYVYGRTKLCFANISYKNDLTPKIMMTTVI